MRAWHLTRFTYSSNWKIAIIYAYTYIGNTLMIVKKESIIACSTIAVTITA